MLNQVRTFFTLIFLAMRMGWEWFRGAWRLTQIEKPIVTIFGGKLVGGNSNRTQQAQELAYKLVDRGFFLLTGGGPGTMEAVHCGAETHNEKASGSYSMGIGVGGVDDTFVSKCGRQFFSTNFFSLRKWLLIHFSKAIIIFPGGYGTVDELFDVLNLLKLHRLHSMPVILIDTDFWEPIKEWVFNVGVKEGTIASGDETLFTICDTNEEVLKIIDENLHSKK